MEDAIHLLLGTDERYLPGAVVTAASAVCAAPQGASFVIHVMDFGLSQEAKQAFSAFLSRFPGVLLEFHEIDLSVFAKLDVPTFGVSRSVAPYGRLLAPEILPGHRVIYVDTDFFIRKNLAELWRLPMDGMALAACLNTSRAGFSNSDVLAWDCPFTDDPVVLARPYYNSGFMLINLDWWRENGVTEHAFGLLKGGKKVSRHDQTLINWLCSGYTITLDMGWNSTPWWTRPLEKGTNLHFSSDFKPWISPLYLPAERLWFDFYDRQVKPHWDPAKRTMRTRVRGFLRFLRHYGLPAVFPKPYCMLRKMFRNDSDQRRAADIELYTAMHRILFRGLDQTTRNTLSDARRETVIKEFK